MAETKRRTKYSGSGRDRFKRVKRENIYPVRSTIPEAETDSDPITESDTTEHSGREDGVNWPSDDESRLRFSPDKQLKRRDESIKHPAKSNGQLSGGINLLSSRKSHAKQKAAAQERKAAKPNADSIARSKKIWERLRRQSHVPLQERKDLITELLSIITGRVEEFVLKHDSGRVIQTAIKYANLDQRKMIATEVKGSFCSLAASRYAKFMIGKLLVHGDNEIRDMIIPEFYGNVRWMINHSEASWILDDIYRAAATPNQRSTLLREWYGAEFAIFRSKTDDNVTADLKLIIHENPGKRVSTMRYLFEIINHLIQKRTTGFTMLHDAMLQYYLNVDPSSEDAAEFIELLKGDEEGDLLKNLAFTKSGAHLVCLVLSSSNAKDRKVILKGYKNIIQTLAFDVNGHRILLTAFDVVDDTVLISKTIFTELIPRNSDQISNEQNHALLSYVSNLYARISILYVFTSKYKSLLPESDIALLKEVHDIRLKTSKKDPNTRRKELIKALSPPLLCFITNNAEDLLQTSFGCHFISEVLLSADGEKHKALQAVVNLTRGREDIRNFLTTPATGRMLKALVLGGRFNMTKKSIDPATPPLLFSDILYKEIKGEIVDWAIGPNSFVVVGLLESVDFTERAELKTILLENFKALYGATLSDAKKTEEDAESKRPNKGMNGGRKGTLLLLDMIHA